MVVYRLAREKWIGDLSGKGAELAGGRWNSKGYPAVYTSCSLALCVCEVLVHTDTDLPPVNMHSAKIHVPDSLVSEEFKNFDWLEDACRAGTEWLRDERSVAVMVPSVVVPSEFNVILNPGHKDFGRVEIQEIQPFAFDPRFFQGKGRSKKTDLDNILKFLP